MRLNFSYAAPDVIEEGIKRLCRVIEKDAERLGSTGAHATGRD